MGLSSDFLIGAAQWVRRDVLGRYDSGIWTITIIDLVTAAGFSICIPFLSLYLYQERGLPMTLVGTAFLISGLVSAATQMVGGLLSDRFGRKFLMLMAMGMSMLTYSGMVVLIWIAAPVWAILVVYIIGRSLGMTARPAISAMVVDLSKKERLTETYGLLRVGRNLGWAAGPAIGGYLATFLSYAWLFGVAVLANALAFCLILFFLRESWQRTPEHVDFRSMFSLVTNRTFVMFTVLCLLIFLTMAQIGSTLSVFTVDRIGFTTAEYGLLLTANGLFVVLFQYPVARGISRLDKSHALILGSLLYGFGYLYLGWVTGFTWALVAMAVITMGEITFSPVATSVVGELAPQDQRGRYMGFFGWSETLGMSFAPLAGGIFLDVFPTSPNCVWGPIAALAFIAAFGFYRWGRVR